MRSAAAGHSGARGAGRGARGGMLNGGTWERWAVELVLGYGVKAGVAAAVVLVRSPPPPRPCPPDTRNRLRSGPLL